MTSQAYILKVSLIGSIIFSALASFASDQFYLFLLSLVLAYVLHGRNQKLAATYLMLGSYFIFITYLFFQFGVALQVALLSYAVLLAFASFVFSNRYWVIMIGILVTASILATLPLRTVSLSSRDLIFYAAIIGCIMELVRISRKKAKVTVAQAADVKMPIAPIGTSKPATVTLAKATPIPEVAKMPFKEFFLLNTIIGEAVMQLKGKADAASVKIEFDNSLPMTALHDPQEFRRIVTLLVSKAIDSYAGKEIQDSLRIVIIKISINNSVIALEIIDSGKGSPSSIDKKSFSMNLVEEIVPGVGTRAIVTFPQN